MSTGAVYNDATLEAGELTFLRQLFRSASSKYGIQVTLEFMYIPADALIAPPFKL